MSWRDGLRNLAYRLLRVVTGPGRQVRVILLYHSVGGGNLNSVPVDAFERQMRFLTTRFRTVRLCDLRTAMGDRAGGARLACVTFDDGYRDNHELALPVLERVGVKATFFVATGFLGGEFATSTGRYPMMTPAQVRALAEHGHEIGAHTVTHPKLTQVPRETARAEIAGSKRALEDLLGRPVPSFAYPKGALDDAVKADVAAAGFSAAVTVREGLVTPGSDWLALDRVWIHSRLSPAVFEAKVSPASAWYARLRRRG